AAPQLAANAAAAAAATAQITPPAAQPLSANTVASSVSAVPEVEPFGSSSNQVYPDPIRDDRSPYATSADVDEMGKPTSSLTFENFVIGDSNRMAYSMAVAVAEMPGKAHLNPLFIYGKSGLGKTHLMRAIQNYIIETLPHLTTIYVDSAELLSDYMEASAAHDKEKSSYKNFKTRYEDADVLLIDDVQYLQGKKQTLDIVFQIFNKLTSQGKQVVLSADRAPKNIDIDERYKSRFNSGGTFDIQPPEIETKLGIVKSFVEEYKLNEGIHELSIPDDIQLYIAESSSSNIRELKSAVTKVIYQMTFFNQPDLSLDDVRHLLESHFSGGPSKRLTIADIQKEVENFYKISHAELIGKKRTRNIIYARQIGIYLCRQMLDLPFNDIGKQFNRDHSTVMYSVTNVEEKMKESRELREELEALKQLIREI
ncbi:chromosomal replication initiator protein DnaA, partial [Raoultibacter timonensis]|uniref:chromosomal replication initiator protein DnaA n=1 Tax=Raoultibacter timonensis TaxID=1907662 RepID=UPI000C82062D